VALGVRRAGVCPNCGEPVSPFAAGCSICGADLESHRRKVGERRLPRPRLRVRLDPHVVLVIFTVLAILLSPFLGLILAAVGAQDRHRNGLIDQRNLFFFLGALDIALLFVPAVRFGILSLIFG
jgi:hypothetical protein